MKNHAGQKNPVYQYTVFNGVYIYIHYSILLCVSRHARENIWDILKMAQKNGDIMDNTGLGSKDIKSLSGMCFRKKQRTHLMQFLKAIHGNIGVCLLY